MGLTLRPLSFALGAEVLGIDLREPLDAATVDEIRQAWTREGVLLFREQDITPAQHVAFTRALGEVEVGNALSHYNHPDHPEIFVVTNHLVNGKPSETRDTGRKWHSDLSYTTRPAAGSLLHAQEIPRVGGDTLFANMYRAYDMLSPAMQAFLEPLWAVHDFWNSSDIKKREPQVVAEMLRRTPPVAQPVVRVHPDTGRKALYVHELSTVRMLDLGEGESDALLKFLFAHCADPENQYRHQWRRHDLLMWDNRCTMHIALPNYDRSEGRHMFRTTLVGTPSGRVVERGPVHLLTPQAA
ncbi:TauD/TfdA dioxygenase family protein [Verticiella sediminum]|nr:TauD/TfdA family dioxygenase [Verticiella sediminum]